MPGCGSAEKRRVRYSDPMKKRKTISPKRSRSGAGSCLTWSKPIPSMNSVTRTRSPDSSVTTSGITTNGWPRQVRANVRWVWASTS